MFTGLIETTGRITEVIARADSRRIAIASKLPHSEIRTGESVAVDGVCLTVTSLAGDRFYATAVEETLRHTTLGNLRAGATVNLERALKVGDRLGGHLVQGHVDGVGSIASVNQRGDDYRVQISFTAPLMRFVPLKGSVTVQGVSLTVSGTESAGFEVALVPETLSRTTLGKLRAREQVNIEVDLLARYLESLLAARG